MPDFRTHASIRERNDLRWFRGAVTWRRWYARLSLAALLLSALLLVAWTLRGDDRVYWAGEVSTAHALFQNDCRQCHVQTGAAVMRLLTLNDAHHSVRDIDCQQCHAQASHDHASRMRTDLVTGCVECHREHRGRERLADVADRHCIQCHADLEVTEGAHAFAASVPSFAKHPEFLPWQSPLESAALAARLGRLELAVEPTDDGWRDRTRLKFNHAKHLVDVGVLTVPPRPGEEAAHTERKQLSCHDCHQPDAAGQYMQPINYERHCAECHALEFSGYLAVGGPLPHRDPEIVFGLLRDRLMKFAIEHPEALAPPEDAAAPRLPNKRPAATAQDRWTWVETQLEQADAGIFKNVEQGCAYCHEWTQEAPATRLGIGFAIVPPNIPDRWLTGSRFDHGKHRELSCVACHDPQYDQRGAGGHPWLAGRTQLSSQLSSDILMPRIETCRACHGERPQAFAPPGVRAHCVDCHDYHAPHAADAPRTDGGGKLDSWLGGGKSAGGQ